VVIALFKEAGVRGRLRILVETESLFNDGTAAVLFAVGAALAAGQAVTPGLFGVWLLQSIGGGILCGALVARVVLALANRTDDQMVKLTFHHHCRLRFVPAAEHFHASGVLRDPVCRAVDRQSWTGHQRVGPHARGDRSLLGLRRVRGEFVDLPVDRIHEAPQRVHGGWTRADRNQRWSTPWTPAAPRGSRSTGRSTNSPRTRRSPEGFDHHARAGRRADALSKIADQQPGTQGREHPRRMEVLGQQERTVGGNGGDVSLTIWSSVRFASASTTLATSAPHRIPPPMDAAATHRTGPA